MSIPLYVLCLITTLGLWLTPRPAGALPEHQATAQGLAILTCVFVMIRSKARCAEIDREEAIDLKLQQENVEIAVGQADIASQRQRLNSEAAERAAQIEAERQKNKQRLEEAIAGVRQEIAIERAKLEAELSAERAKFNAELSAERAKFNAELATERLRLQTEMDKKEDEAVKRVLAAQAAKEQEANQKLQNQANYLQQVATQLEAERKNLEALKAELSARPTPQQLMAAETEKMLLAIENSTKIEQARVGGELQIEEFRLKKMQELGLTPMGQDQGDPFAALTNEMQQLRKALGHASPTVTVDARSGAIEFGEDPPYKPSEVGIPGLDADGTDPTDFVIN